LVESQTSGQRLLPEFLALAADARFSVGFEPARA
jgi:hypothetical protein